MNNSQLTEYALLLSTARRALKNAYRPGEIPPVGVRTATSLLEEAEEAFSKVVILYPQPYDKGREAFAPNRRTNDTENEIAYHILSTLEFLRPGSVQFLVNKQILSQEKVHYIAASASQRHEDITLAVDVIDDLVHRMRENDRRDDFTFVFYTASCLCYENSDTPEVVSKLKDGTADAAVLFKEETLGLSEVVGSFLTSKEEVAAENKEAAVNETISALGVVPPPSNVKAFDIARLKRALLKKENLFDYTKGAKEDNTGSLFETVFGAIEQGSASLLADINPEVDMLHEYDPRVSPTSPPCNAYFGIDPNRNPGMYFKHYLEY